MDEKINPSMRLYINHKCGDVFEFETANGKNHVNCDLEKGHPGYHVFLFTLDGKNYIVKWANGNMPLDLDMYEGMD